MTIPNLLISSLLFQLTLLNLWSMLWKMPQRVTSITHSRLPSSSNLASPKHKKLASFMTLDPRLAPTTLLMHMCPLSSDSTSEEFLYQFKSVMPTAVRTTLAGRKFESIEVYTEVADDVAENTQECTNVYLVGRPSKVDTSWMCFYYTCFGNKAQKCRASCKFKMMGKESAGHQ